MKRAAALERKVARDSSSPAFCGGLIEANATLGLGSAAKQLEDVARSAAQVVFPRVLRGPH